MWHRSLPVLVVLVVTLAGCSDDAEPVVVEPQQATTAEPAYDPSLEPSAAVLAVVPGDATVLEVTDFAQVRFQLGFGEITSRSSEAVRRGFWTRAATEAALLSPGMLRGRGTESYGFTQDDVSWEAHFEGPSGAGYVVKFRDDLDMRGVEQAAKASGGPLAGAVVVASVHLAALGATREPGESWAADPELVELAGQKAGATYFSRACLDVAEVFGGGVADELAPTPAADLASLDPLGPFSVGFGGRLVTVKLGPGRSDTFARARLAERLPATDPEFGTGFADPVADPASGRIGYTIGDAPTAARLTQERQLPFALCGP